MSLSYNSQYSIAAGIHMAFHSKADKRMLSVSHGQKKRDDMKKIFPYRKFEEWTKENFIIACLYIQFSKSPSSLIASITELTNLDEKEAMKFKNEIIYYKKYLIDDMNLIQLEQGNSITIEYMLEKYIAKEIKWFTFYFFLLSSNADINELSKSRINKMLYKKIRKLLLYVTFSEKSMLEMRNIMKDTITIY